MKTGLPEIKGKLQAMAVLAEDMVARSVKALLEGDTTLANQVCADDDQLDRMEAEVDELAVQILAAGAAPKEPGRQSFGIAEPTEQLVPSGQTMH